MQLASRCRLRIVGGESSTCLHTPGAFNAGEREDEDVVFVRSLDSGFRHDFPLHARPQERGEISAMTSGSLTLARACSSSDTKQGNVLQVPAYLFEKNPTHVRL